MHISFKQPELEEAIRDYVHKCGITGAVGEISFTAGRGDSGVTTEVEVTSRAPLGLVGQILAEKDLASPVKAPPIEITDSKVPAKTTVGSFGVTSVKEAAGAINLTGAVTDSAVEAFSADAEEEAPAEQDAGSSLFS
jgi:hypothetical protein